LLLRQTEDTRAAAQAHEQLTTLVASGGGPADLCAMLAQRVGGRVVVCDEGGRQIVAADRDGRIEDRAQAESWVDDAVYAALPESSRTGRSVACGNLRKVCAVLGGNERLGGLVLYADQPLNDMRARIFERGAMVMGVVLLVKAQRASSLMSDASAVLHGLVYGAGGNFEPLARQAERYGLNIRQPMRLLLIRAERDDRAYLCRQLMDRLGTPGALFDNLGESLLVLVNESQIAHVRTAALSCLGRYRGKFSGILSGPIQDSRTLPRSLDMAERSLALLDALGRHGEIFGEEQLALYAPLFSRADAAAIENFLDATLGGLYTDKPLHDGRRVDLARTLLAYLDHGHHAAEVARHLGVHINTLRQRLEAIDTLLPDWRTAGRALEIHMALRLWQLRDHDLSAPRDRRS
ncbi:MAG: helix-turn-helix domain-containing protein, partial [Alcaligenaceae bacterium]|nr:helix-turn-helix domain-containing protein [Alcaligenaceae bacterium]